MKNFLQTEKFLLALIGIVYLVENMEVAEIICQINEKKELKTKIFTLIICMFNAPKNLKSDMILPEF